MRNLEFSVSLLLFCASWVWAAPPCLSGKSGGLSPSTFAKSTIQAVNTETGLKKFGPNFIYWPTPLSKNCQNLILYFPGNAQELGKGSQLQGDARKQWVNELLNGKNYHLKPNIDQRGCPVLFMGDAVSTLSESELKKVLKKTGMTGVEILSHSAGYQGLRESLTQWSKDLIKKVKHLGMLDNFYSLELSQFLKSTFTNPGSKSICTGFATPHNRENAKAFSSVCRVKSYGKDGLHKTPVKEYFTSPSP